jgi:hypothetical protein
MSYTFTKNLTIPKTFFPVCENICVGKYDKILADEEFVICEHSRESFWAFYLFCVLSILLKNIRLLFDIKLFSEIRSFFNHLKRKMGEGGRGALLSLLIKDNYPDLTSNCCTLYSSLIHLFIDLTSSKTIISNYIVHTLQWPIFQKKSLLLVATKM